MPQAALITTSNLPEIRSCILTEFFSKGVLQEFLLRFSMEELTSCMKCNQCFSMSTKEHIKYLKEQRRPPDQYAFRAHMEDIKDRGGYRWNEIFLKSRIPVRAGYKLIYGYKITRQRDYILTLCFNMKMTLPQVQTTLLLYGLGILNASYKRDFLFMYMICQRPGSVEQINRILVENNEPALKVYGT